jgi:cell division cycle 20-like protein 1 (cofactor of APC complex)
MRLNNCSENSSPIVRKPAFKINPVCGFDEDTVIVPKQKQRKIAKIPYKVLDAPALQDDFYLNLVDWSPYNNLAVGLSSCIYIWSATNSKVTKLHDLGPRDSVTSVCWSKRGQHLSIGTNSGLVQVWDVNKCALVRSMKGHEGRVGAIAC